MFDNNIYQLKWIMYVKSILDNCGFSFVWYLEKDDINPNWLITALHLKIYDIAKQNWLSELNTNGLCLNYHIFKNSVGFENYLNMLDYKDRLTLNKFRCGNHRLPLRYASINSSNRYCSLCDNQEISD